MMLGICSEAIENPPWPHLFLIPKEKYVSGRQIFSLRILVPYLDLLINMLSGIIVAGLLLEADLQLHPLIFEEDVNFTHQR